MNRIGVRGHDFGRMSVEELPKYLKNLGFNAAQLAPAKALQDVNTFEDITEKLLNDCRESFIKNDVEISVLGCYVDIGLMDKNSRLAEVDKFIKGISHAKTLGAKVIGTETSHCPLNSDNREIQYQGLKDSVLRMIEEAEKLDVNVAIEPVAVHTLNSPELTKRLIDDVNSDKLNIILDAVNLFTLDNIANQKQIVTDCFELFGDKIKVLHIKDVSLIGNDDIKKINVVNGSYKWEHIGSGIVDYKHIVNYVKGKDVSLLREEATLGSYADDIVHIKSLLS